MVRSLTALPAMWGVIGASTIGDHTGISIGLVLAGIAGSLAIAWRARGELDKIHRSIRQVSDKQDMQSNEIGIIEEKLEAINKKGGIP